MLISLVSVLNLLYFYISTFRSVCAVPNMAVFCSSLTSCFPGMLLTYFLNEFEIVPVAPIILSKVTYWPGVFSRVLLRAGYGFIPGKSTELGWVDGPRDLPGGQS